MEQHCAGGISSSCETIRLGAGKSLLLSRQDSTVATGSASTHPCTVQVMLGKNERLSRLDQHVRTSGITIQVQCACNKYTSRFSDWVRVFDQKPVEP